MVEKQPEVEMAVSIPKIGLQLYTLKEEFAADPFATLRSVAAIGYEGVEFVGSALNSIDALQLHDVLTESGLEIAGAAFELEELDDGIDAVIRVCRSINCPTVVVPSIRKADCRSIAALKDVALRMNFYSSRCRTEGLTFLYHTHGIELTMVEGRRALDHLLEYWDSSLVKLEVDTHWVERSGLDAVTFLKEYGSHCSSIHFKDMRRFTQQDSEVGEGDIDMPGVALEGLRNNVRWFIVEQEEFELPPMESVNVSFRNVCRMREDLLHSIPISETESGTQL